MQPAHLGSQHPRRQIRWYQYALVFPLALLIELWLRTLRLKVDPSMRERVRQLPNGLICVLWHNRCVPVSHLHRFLRGQRRRIYGLVSLSKDGTWLTAAFHLLGLKTVRGSTKRRGMGALREMLQLLEQNTDLGVTVDGPRGPVYQTQPGTALLALKSGHPILLAGINFSRAWRVPSWDGLFIPWPFSRVELKLTLWEDPRAHAPDGQRETLVQAIQAELLRLSAGSDPRLPRPGDPGDSGPPAPQCSQKKAPPGAEEPKI